MTEPRYRQPSLRTITVRVTAAQLQDLAGDMAANFKADGVQITHKVAVGTNWLPGDWVVVTYYKDTEGLMTVTLAELED